MTFQDYTQHWTAYTRKQLPVISTHAFGRRPDLGASVPALRTTLPFKDILSFNATHVPQIATRAYVRFLASCPTVR